MKLTIIETSDMHGYIMPTNYSQKNMDLSFGTAKAATVIEHITQHATGPVIKIDNGDFIQGSPLSYYIKKSEHKHVRELTQAINAIGYDVSVLGNHEFNYGLDYLNAAIASYEHPVICANILNVNNEVVFGKPYHIIEKDGVKIAILGLTTQYIPHWEQPATVKNLTFNSCLETAKHYVPLLKAQADIVVVAYHGGFERDLTTGEPTELLTGENEGYAIATQVEGIDALVTGHQHRVLATKINNVPIIQPGQRGSHVGVIELDIEKIDGKYVVVNSDAQLHDCTNVNANEAIINAFRQLQDDVEIWLDQSVGKINGNMRIENPHTARLVEHPYVEFINAVQLEATQAQISATALFNNEGKGFNETITMRDIITNYIYPNTLAVLNVSGADLKEALEKCANYYCIENGEIIFNPVFVEPKPQYYNYDIYEGIDYILDFRQPVGQRVVKLEYNGKTVQPTDTFELVTNQYRAVGGGDYTMFSPSKIVREVQIDMTELIAEYLRKHETITATVNNNYQTIYN